MNTLAALFLAASIQHHLPPELLSSLCYAESTHDVSAIHHDDAGSDSIGVCQVKLKTAKWMGYKGNAKGLLDPKTNINIAAKYLSYQLKRYHNISKAVVAYNRGNATNLTGSLYQRRVFSIWNKQN